MHILLGSEDFSLKTFIVLFLPVPRMFVYLNKVSDHP